MNLKNQKLIDIRNKNKLSQKELAEKVDCTQGMISKIEKGVRIPRDKLKIKISKALNCSVEELFYKSE